MRIMSPKLAFKHNIIYNQSDIINFRNKLDLYEKYKSGDLLIWINNNLSANIEYKVSEISGINDYYRLLNVMDNSLEIEDERRKFFELLNEIKNPKDSNLTKNIDKLKKLIFQYELFFNELAREDIEDFLNSNLNIFIGFSTVLDVYKDQISMDFSSKIREIIVKGYEGDSFNDNHILRVDADSQRQIEINKTFIIKNCQGPLTINKYNPLYKNVEEQNKAIEFLDVDNKNVKDVLKKIFHPTSIELKHSLAFIEYIEVDNHEL